MSRLPDEIPVSALRAFLAPWASRYGDTSDAIEQLARDAKVRVLDVRAIVRGGELESLPFDAADRLLTCSVGPMAWHTDKLAGLYGVPARWTVEEVLAHADLPEPEEEAREAA